MNPRLKVQPIITLLLLAAFAMQACAASVTDEAQAPRATSAAGEVPTWTPRPSDLTQTALPTATRPASVSIETTVTLTPTRAISISSTPKTVTVTMEGGNLFIRRGPSLDYNYVGVLYDGDVVTATGRDRISRWIRVELSSRPGVQGWITTETQYTRIVGDVGNLPFIQTEPALPAYIRNCTKHKLWVMPAEVQLLDKFNTPYNEERFPVGIYQIYDLENPENKPIEEVSLSEGKTVDIQYDWAGEKAKCE